MNSLISVVIPIYKVEKYLRRCIDSVIYQSYKDIEIILVDDGSPDNCPIICDDYARMDSRIKVLHKKNGGSSDARNKGIALSSGEYILFLDSDDYWESTNFLENIVDRIRNKQSDIILYSCKDFYVDTGKLVNSHFNYDLSFIRSHSVGQVIEMLFEEHLFPGAAWLVAVKRSIILSNDIYFIQGIKGEDYDWLINLFLHVNSIDAVNDSFYIYIKGRKDSITGTSDIKSIKDLLFTIDKWKVRLFNNEHSSSKYLLGHLSFIYVTVLVIYSMLNKNQQQQVFQDIKDRESILEFATDKRVRFLKYLIFILGINYTSRLLKMYRSISYYE